jgi:dihydrodipicolinate synthase/N-acetylneuraminate lyase
LLPFTAVGDVHWEDFDRHVDRTLSAGLVPAVNMDTGYVHLIDESVEDQVLRRTSVRGTGVDAFVAGAVVRDRPTDGFNYDHYARRIEAIQHAGGTPIIFPSFGLHHGSDDEVLARFQRLAGLTTRFYAFELGQMFAPCGRIYSLELFTALLELPACVGAKHSSLNRQAEWQRLAIRDKRRPEFRLMTGNDLAIDMVNYGSDYLLGLSTMAPDLFALRDRFWLDGDSRFYELNDWLQYLGCLTFRAPVPAYRHSAAQWLNLRGWNETDRPHPACPQRPASDREILSTLWSELGRWLESHGLTV